MYEETNNENYSNKFLIQIIFVYSNYSSDNYLFEYLLIRVTSTNTKL